MANSLSVFLAERQKADLRRNAVVSGMTKVLCNPIVRLTFH